MEKKIHLVARQRQKPKLLRVVGYARVSSGKEAMLHSLAAQVDYYQSLKFSRSFCKPLHGTSGRGKW